MDYKEKLRLAKEALESGSYDKETIEFIFPELRESEDERMKEAIIATIHLYYGEPLEDEAKEMIAWLEKQGQSIVWSEEDKKMFKLTENLLLVTDSNLSANQNGRITPLADGEYSSLKIQIAQSISWLRILKDKVLPQPKQEWSDEDNEHIKSIISTIECSKAQFPNAQAVLEAYNSDLIWLKSIKERCNWKPSDEQMNALSYVVNLMASSERPTENDLYYNILKSLRQQLKKLTE